MSTIDMTKVAGLQAVDTEGKVIGTLSVDDLTELVAANLVQSTKNEVVQSRSASLMSEASTLAATDEYENQLPQDANPAFVRTLDSSGNPKQTAIASLASVVGGLIGFNSKTSTKIITTSNYELYKLFTTTSNWVREIACIKINESGTAYGLTIAYYSMQGTPSINVEWGSNGKRSAIKFYCKGYDVFVIFNYDQGSPQKAIIQSSCGVELISKGVKPDGSYTDITPD